MTSAALTKADEPTAHFQKKSRPTQAQFDQIRVEKKARVLRALAEGQILKQIRKEIVDSATLSVWRRKDRAFDEAYKKLQRKKPQRELTDTFEGMQRRILTLAQSGMKLKQIEEIVCSHAIMTKMRKLNPDFHRKMLEYGKIACLNEQARRRFQRGINWDRVQVLLIEGMPRHVVAEQLNVSGDVIGSRYQRDPEWARPIRNAREDRNVTRRNATVRFLATHSVDKLEHEPRLLGREAARRLRDRDPTFDFEIKEARTRRLARTPAEARRKAQDAQPLLAAAMAAVPASIPSYIRDDIIGNLVLAVLSGEINQADVPRKAKEFITAYWRERPEFRSLSLDAPRFDNGSSNLHEVVSRSLWQD